MVEEYANILKKYAGGARPVNMDVYDYRNEGKLESLFDSIFISCMSTLQGLAKKAGLPEIEFAFESIDDPTGITRSEQNTIVLSDKIVSQLYNCFCNAEHIVKAHAAENLKKAFVKRNASPTEVLISEIAEFQCDHEFAHLLQDLIKPMTSNDASETTGQNGRTNFDKHAREIDADWFATEQLAQRIAKKIQIKSGDFDDRLPEMIEAEISISLIAISNFLYRAIKEHELLFEKGKYPDPQIRAEIITRNLINNICTHIPEDVEFDKEKVISNVTNFLSEMFEELDILELGNNFATDVAKDLKNNADKVKKYINELYEYAESKPNLCMNGKAESLGLSTKFDSRAARF